MCEQSENRQAWDCGERTQVWFCRPHINKLSTVDHKKTKAEPGQYTHTHTGLTQKDWIQWEGLYTHTSTITHTHLSSVRDTADFLSGPGWLVYAPVGEGDGRLVNPLEDGGIYAETLQTDPHIQKLVIYWSVTHKRTSLYDLFEIHRKILQRNQITLKQSWKFTSKKSDLFRTASINK